MAVFVFIEASLKHYILAVEIFRIIPTRFFS